MLDTVFSDNRRVQVIFAAFSMSLILFDKFIHIAQSKYRKYNYISETIGVMAADN